MSELLRAAARRSDLLGSDEALALLQAAERGQDALSQTRPPTPRGQEPLSEREVEVLRLLATNLTGPEIADQPPRRARSVSTRVWWRPCGR